MPKGIADSSALSSGYIIYLTASADAAHPTITALGRHLPEDKTGFSQELHIVAPVEDEEALMTVDFLCGALLGACYGVGEVLGGSRVAPEVKARAEEYQQIKGVIAQRLNS